MQLLLVKAPSEIIKLNYSFASRGTLRIRDETLPAVVAWLVEHLLHKKCHLSTVVQFPPRHVYGRIYLSLLAVDNSSPAI